MKITRIETFSPQFVGFEIFKIRGGSECGHDRDEWPGRTEEIIATMRRAGGVEIHPDWLAHADYQVSAPD